VVWSSFVPIFGQQANFTFVFNHRNKTKKHVSSILISQRGFLFLTHERIEILPVILSRLGINVSHNINSRR
jgi:hypothetical protein